jgi:hypothetical protein
VGDSERNRLNKVVACERNLLSKKVADLERNFLSVGDSERNRLNKKVVACERNLLSKKSG